MAIHHGMKKRLTNEASRVQDGMTANPMAQLPLLSKRWQNGNERFVPPSHIVDVSRMRVEPIPERTSRELIVQHHYSHTMPATRLCLGVFYDRRLVGSIVFSVPMSNAVLTKYLDVTANEGCELGRMVLFDEVGFNAESFAIARALRILKSHYPAMKRVVSFADPMERRDAAGNIQKNSHFGQVYRASNAVYMGRSGARWLHVAPNGSIVSPRAISKVRNEETGRDYAERMLVAAGVESRSSFEHARDWLDRVLPTLQRFRHNGNLAFRFDLRSR